MLNYYELSENIVKLAFAQSLCDREIYFKKCMEMVEGAKFHYFMEAMNSKKETE